MSSTVQEPLPPAWGNYGYVVGRVIQAVGDDADADDIPGAKPVAGTGYVTLTYLDGTRVVTDLDSGQTAIIPQAIVCNLDDEGYISHQDKRGVWLWAGNWRVSFSGAVGLPSWSFTVLGTETVDQPLQVMSKLGVTPPSGAIVTTIKIDASVQPGQYLGLDETGTLVIGVDAPTGGGGDDASPATTTSLGTVKLSGDLSGTASAPTVTGGSHHGHTLDQVTDSATRVAMTPAERATLSTQSGTNTGDQVLPTWDTITGKPTVIAAGTDAATARTAIGAGTSNLAIGTSGSTAAAGNDSRLSNARTPTAHAATHASGGSDPITPAAIGAVPTSHTVAGHPLTGNVVVSASDVGLGSVNNTADADKPVSTDTTAALALKAPLVSPALTGTPTAPTANTGTSNTQIATTEFAMNALKTYELRGAGSPYNSVTPPGAGYYYTDTSGTGGAWRWVSTGTTKTSWTVLYGDTGPRSLLATVINGWKANGIDFQRVGSSVSLRVDWLNGTSATDQIVFPIPVGFRPMGNLRFVGCLYGVSGGDTGIFGVEANNFVVTNPYDKSQISGHESLTTWVTADAWPTTLPGTA